MSKPLILITNDDGITAPGIQALIEVAKDFGEVRVVAPDKPQSGMGHAITVSKTIHIQETTVQNVPAVACSGTPVDCVKLAVNKLLPKKPDLVLSGINHGSNSSINVIYSGTMSAAVEGALENIPSAGFSLLNHSIDADFSAAKKVVRQVVEKMLSEKLPDNICLNVNIPDIEYDLINGIKICRQAVANWEEYFDERTDPAGNKYYWLTGKFVNYDTGTDTDEWALANNYVSIVPVQYDLTNYSVLEKLKLWE